MSNWYECQKCKKSCDWRQTTVKEQEAGMLRIVSVCCSAPVKVKP